MIINTQKQIKRYIYINNSYIRKIITLYHQKHLPLEYSDLYNEILFLLFNFLKNKNLELEQTRKTMGSHCKYWIFNINRKYSRNKHKILNNYIPMEKCKEFAKVFLKIREKSEPNKLLKLLTPIQKQIIELLSIGHSHRQIEKIIKKSRYYINIEIESIKEKIIPYLKQKQLI